MTGHLPVDAITAASLSQLDRLALTMAKAQLKRGENPPMNTTARLLTALERIVAAAPVIAAQATTTEREACAQLAEQYDAICCTDDEDDRPFADLIRQRGAR